ncbi:MAG: DUF4974 domain-containing protein [Odoribacter sp.]|nr:DUF4974 domain-containing protein [Odoribacter sp.]
MERQETDIDYILSHLLNPESLLDTEFQEWLQDAGHRKLFEEVRNQREAFLCFSLEPSIDLEREYERQQAKIRFLRQRRVWRWTMAAACVAVVFGISIAGWLFQPTERVGEELRVSLEGRKTAELILSNGERIHLEKNRIELRECNGTLVVNDSSCNLTYHRDTSQVKPVEEKPAVYHTLVVPSGADYTLQMADGTNVRLNCETKFRFPVEFTGKERRVFLEGEAYFEVKKAKEWPFIVETDCIQVKATGTCFNVKSYQDEEVVQATLVNGAVEVVNGKAEGELVGLLPDQQYCMNKHTAQAEVRQVDVSLYTGWTEGMFVFKKQRLEEVMNILARWYTINVTYADESVKNLRISANLGRYEHIDSMLELLRALNKVGVERKGEMVIVSQK